MWRAILSYSVKTSDWRLVIFSLFTSMPSCHLLCYRYHLQSPQRKFKWSTNIFNSHMLLYDPSSPRVETTSNASSRKTFYISAILHTCTASGLFIFSPVWCLADVSSKEGFAIRFDLVFVIQISFRRYLLFSLNEFHEVAGVSNLALMKFNTALEP